MSLLRGCINTIWYSLRYRNRFKSNLIQDWTNVHIKVSSKGSIAIGKRLKARGQDNILVESGNMRIGDYCFFNYNVSITCIEKIEIGSHVQIANNVVIVDHNHNYGTRGFSCNPVYIADNVWIGANSVILPGVSIGKGAVIAAGSVINKDVPEYSLAAGVPGKIIKKYESI